MIYRPIESRRLWDTWLFPWEDRYHLFYLETQETPNDHIGHAVSKDLVHWEGLESISTRGQPGEWNHRRTATGMVLCHNNQFWMFVGGYDPEIKEGDAQVVGVYLSQDLVHWELCRDNPVIYPGGAYLVDPADGFFNVTDWRDSYIMWREEDRFYHAFLCARMPNWNHENFGSCVAHIRSKDLMHWDYLPPIAVAGMYPNMEVPEIFELNGRYYLTFSTNSLTGLRINTPTRESVRGTFYMVSDSFDGPFELPGDPLLIGAAHGNLGAYVARSIEYHGERLLYHQVGDSDIARTAWGTPKIIRTNSDGTLRLEYFPSLNELETDVLVSSFKDIPPPETTDMGMWIRGDDGFIGTNCVAGTSCKLIADASDFHLRCTVSSLTACCAGIVLRETNKKTGVIILMDFENQRLQIGKSEVPPVYNYAHGLLGLRCHVYDSRKYCLHMNQSYELRCLFRNEFFEVYINDIWVFTVCLPDAPKSGAISLYVERGKAEFNTLRLAQLEPLD